MKSLEAYNSELETLDGIKKCVLRYADSLRTDRDEFNSDWCKRYLAYLTKREKKVQKKIRKLERDFVKWDDFPTKKAKFLDILKYYGVSLCRISWSFDFEAQEPSGDILVNVDNEDLFDDIYDLYTLNGFNFNKQKLYVGYESTKKILEHEFSAKSKNSIYLRESDIQGK